MNIILSIHPEYSKEIYDGTKQYEFRRKIPKVLPERVYIYTTKPVFGITGYFDIETIISDHPDKLWEQVKKYAGISEKDFKKYFNNCDKAYAYKIKKAVKFIIPAVWRDGGPQSFYYLYHNGQDSLNKAIKNKEYILNSAVENQFTEKIIEKIGQNKPTEWNKFYPEFHEWYQKVIKEIKEKPKERQILIKIKGLNPTKAQIIGFCTIKNTPEEKKICTIYINPQFRKKGYATELINAAINKLRIRNPLFTVNENINENFQGIIEKFNWKLTEKEKDKYIANNTEYIYN